MGPKGMATRPTPQRVREAMFNVLAPRLAGALFLDLFAGTGIVGIEALSRGAEHAVFVEQYRPNVRLIARNLELAGLSDRGRILARGVATVVVGLSGSGPGFDIVFLDPPYRQGLAADTLNRIGDLNLVRPGGLVIAEHGVSEILPVRPGRLLVGRRLEYGDTGLTFYQPE